MDKQRIDMLADDLWKEVLVTLAAAPDVTYEDAERIATAVEQAFRAQMSPWQ